MTRKNIIIFDLVTESANEKETFFISSYKIETNT